MLLSPLLCSSQTLSLSSLLSSDLFLGSTEMASSPCSDLGKFHVLAVDDSIIDRKLIERLLRTCSYQVTVVDSGIKAMEFLGGRIEEVNLIITDYSMPGMTGYELLRKVKGCSSLKDIPVVIMSSEDVPARIDRCLEEGAEEFFLKPVRQADVNRLSSHLLTPKSPEALPSRKRKAAAAEEEEFYVSAQLTRPIRRRRLV